MLALQSDSNLVIYCVSSDTPRSASKKPAILNDGRALFSTGT